MTIITVEVEIAKVTTCGTLLHPLLNLLASRPCIVRGVVGYFVEGGGYEGQQGMETTFVKIPQGVARFDFYRKSHYAGRCLRLRDARDRLSLQLTGFLKERLEARFFREILQIVILLDHLRVSETQLNRTLKHRQRFGLVGTI